MKKIFASLLLSVLVLTIAVHAHMDRKVKSLPAKKFSRLWQRDFQYLRKLKGFPSIDQIRSVRFISGNQMARSTLFQSDLPEEVETIQTRKNEKAKYDLEILLVGWNKEEDDSEKKESGVVVQYELLNASNKNKVWEFSRTILF